MTFRQFIFIACICAFETYFFNDTLLTGEYLFAGFWGFLLFRDLKKARAISLFSKKLSEAANSSKKKD
ncbi:DUF3272 family protein [Streptococcus catagoni]|uniref:DUF3272 family protein n=1 Tax=Streptococcus catagoni TaxID=2654874 RepID=UPI00140C708E|nr:DUF3272 family protein [Streptococcus catagoni]